ncbi:MAG: hypothetical protein P8182_08380 [Deltaproteobacteria bacterium]
MNLLTVVYVGLVVVGLAWVAYRLRAYISEQRERESRWVGTGAENEFRSYLKGLGETKSTNSQGKKETSRNESPSRHVPDPVANDKDGGTTRKG